MRRVLFYCQHVLGMGHLVRSLELARGLENCDVCFLNGGEMAEGIAPPSNAQLVQLPVLKSDEDFRDLHASDGQNLDHVKEQRRAKILDVLEVFQPDAVVIELFPFGRRKFAFELIPLLERIRSHHRSTKVACSLRDILVSKDDQERYERKVRATMDEYFDMLLVHSDPAFQRLEESFASADQIRCPINYTGFVVRRPQTNGAGPRHRETPRIVASIGGGRVGGELLDAALHASVDIGSSPQHKLQIFTGPFLADGDFSRLKSLAATNPFISVERFTPSLPSLLQDADLSISMAGYNTCMDVIVTGVPALLYPFTGGGNQEQTTRARKLQELGAAEVLGPRDLDPKNLAQTIRTRLIQKQPKAELRIDIDGVRKTAALLHDLMEIQ